MPSAICSARGTAWKREAKTVQYLAGHESSKITMDIYAKVKYNKPDELAGVLTDAFAQWDEAEYGTAQ